MSRRLNRFKRDQIKERKREIKINILMATDNLSRCEAENKILLKKRDQQRNILDSARMSKPFDVYNCPPLLRGAQSVESVDTCIRSGQPVTRLVDEYGETEIYR